MTDLETYKLQYLNQHAQFILFDSDGQFLESCDSLFSTKNLNQTPVYKWFKLLESIFEAIKILEPEQEMIFPRVEEPADYLSGNYDFTFIRISQEKILLIIYDHTELYNRLRNFQQKCNQANVDNQRLQWELASLKSKRTA